jgi:hypothetical protein
MQSTAITKTVAVLLVIAVGHAVFYLGPNLYLPFDLEELFLLGCALVLADSAFAVFVAIKLLIRLLRE